MAESPAPVRTDMLPLPLSRPPLPAPATDPTAVVALPGREDRVAVEAPLEVWLGGKPAAVLMRTPGADEELVRGFLFAEGLIARAADVLSLERPADIRSEMGGDAISVRLADPKRTRAGLDRDFVSNSACGVCGKKTIASLAVKAVPSDSPVRVGRSVLETLPARLRDAQPTFALTGGVHASGLFTPDGHLVAVREDVGRHNALDKLIGWALAGDRLPLRDSVLLLSGRVSYELVQKAAVAGVPVVAAVGAPSSLAVDLAGRFGITLIGFLRPGAMNVYTHPHRLD